MKSPPVAAEAAIFLMAAKASACLGITADQVSSPSTGTGQGRVALVTTTAGAKLVIKWGDREWGDGVRRSLTHLEVLRSRGWPSPAVVACGTTDDGFAYAVEQVDGAPATGGLSPRALDEIFAALELQTEAEMDATSRQWSFVDSCVYDDHAGWWAGVPESARALAEWVRTWALQERPEPVWDYVHLDLNLGNIMVADDRLMAIIDIDHLSLGDRVVDLAALAFDAARVGASYLDRVREVALSIGGEARWRRAVAYNTSARLGWPGAASWAVPEKVAAVALMVISGS